MHSEKSENDKGENEHDFDYRIIRPDRPQYRRSIIIKNPEKQHIDTRLKELIKEKINHLHRREYHQHQQEVISAKMKVNFLEFLGKIGLNKKRNQPKNRHRNEAIADCRDIKPSPRKKCKKEVLGVFSVRNCTAISP